MPIPFDILFRRVGGEDAATIAGEEIVHAVELVYAMYSTSFRPNEMKPCYKWLDGFRNSAQPHYPLYPPTEVP
jgi:hypothetical protein